MIKLKIIGCRGFSANPKESDMLKGVSDVLKEGKIVTSVMNSNNDMLIFYEVAELQSR